MKNDLINTSFVMNPESQFLSQKQDRLAKRDLKTAAITPFPLKMPDSDDPEVQRKAAGCVRPTTRGTVKCGQLGSGRTRPYNDTVRKVSSGNHATSKDWDRDLVLSRVI